MPSVYPSNSAVPAELLLGNLVFYTLHDMTITEDELTDVFKNNGLSTSYIRKIAKADAYRRATSSAKQKTIQTPNGVYRLEVNEVKSDTDRIVRIIGKKEINENGTDMKEKVKYDPVAELVFDRATDSVNYGLSPQLALSETNEVQAVCEDIVLKYQDWSVNHSRDTIRNLFSRILTDCHPISLMPTGMCKFIPKGKKDTIYRLKNVSKDLSDYTLDKSQNVMEIIPVIDTDDQRVLIDKCYKAEISDSVVEMIKELNGVIQNKSTLPTRTANAYLDRYKVLRTKINEYSSLLNTGAEVLTDKLGEVFTLIEKNK